MRGVVARRAVCLSASQSSWLVGIARAAVISPLAAFPAEAFGTGVRYGVVSVGFQMGALVAGAPTPLVATALVARSGGETGLITALVVVAALVPIAATYAVSETDKRQMID